MDDALGKVEYDTILDAKIRTFDSIHSGEAAKFLARRREREAQRLREAMTRRRGAKVANRFVTQRAIEQLRRLGP
jgi:hypothetical protein